MNPRTKEREALAPVEKLRELFAYSPNCGTVVWRSKGGAGQNAHLALQPAGGVNSDGYIRVGVSKLSFLGHRVAWAIHHGEWPDGEIDHIDRNKLNNRIDNLRVVSRSANSLNRETRRDNTSGSNGVLFHKASNKWMAHVFRNGKHKHIGLFPTKELAEYARFWRDLLDPSIPLQHTLRHQPESQP